MMVQANAGLAHGVPPSGTERFPLKRCNRMIRNGVRSCWRCGRKVRKVNVKSTLDSLSVRKRYWTTPIETLTLVKREFHSMNQCHSIEAKKCQKIYDIYRKQPRCMTWPCRIVAIVMLAGLCTSYLLAQQSAGSSVGSPAKELTKPELSKYVGDSDEPGSLAKNLSPSLNRADVDRAMRKVADWQLQRVQEHWSQDWTFAAMYA